MHVEVLFVQISHIPTCHTRVELLHLSGVLFSLKTHNGGQGALKRAVVLKHHFSIRPTVRQKEYLHC